MAAELLEDRTLLAATFSVLSNDTISVMVSDSPGDEEVTVSESGSDYIFQLDVGVWMGTDGAGFSGAGTSTLRIDKASAANRDGGIWLVSDTSVDLDSADLSTLTLFSVSAESLHQDAGDTLIVSAATLGSFGVTSIAGDVIGGAEAVQLVGGNGIHLQNATVTTTSGQIILAGGNGNGNFDGVTLVDSAVVTETGRILVTAWGGKVAGSAANRGFVMTGSHIRSTGANAGSHSVEITGEGGVGSGAFAIQVIDSSIITSSANIRLRGNNPLFRQPSTATGVQIEDSRVQSANGNIEIIGDSFGGGDGGAGVSLHRESYVISTGTATILISGRTKGASNVGVSLGPIVSGVSCPIVQSVKGDIRIEGYGGSVGLSIFETRIASIGTGADAADILLVGVGERRGIDIYGPHSFSRPISSRDGDIRLVGTHLLPGDTIMFPPAGVAVEGRVTATANGNVSVVARAGLSSNGVPFETPALLVHGIGLVSSANGYVVLLADSMDFTDGRVVSSTNKVILSTYSENQGIVLGESQFPLLQLSAAELDRVGARVLQIGRAGHLGGIKVTGLISDANSSYGSLLFVTNGSLTDVNFEDSNAPPTYGKLQVNTVLVDVDSVDLRNPEIAFFSGEAANSITLDNQRDLRLGDLSARTIFVDVTGTVTIAPGATLDTSKFQFTETVFYPDPPAMPQAQFPLLIRNDGSDAIIGNFAGLPEGTQIATVGGRPVHITYQASKPDGMNDAVIELHVEPFARDDFYETPEDETLTGNVLANDIDFGNGPLTVTNVTFAADGSTGVGTNITLPSGATLWVDPDGNFYYTPGSGFDDLAADEERTDRFRYEATDAYGGSWVAEVWITVVGEGTEDLIGFNGGGWYVAESDGDSFGTSAWVGWSDAEWDALQQGDFNGDGRTDVLGLLDGMWFVGTSTGSAFTTSLWSRWSNVEWQDVLVADLDLDGNDDILARVGGNWWAALSDGTTFNAPTLWASWSDLPWDHFAIGTSYFFGASAPGTPTLFGFIDGEWWAARINTSNDGFSGASKWATLPNADYDAIKLFDYDGDNASDFAVLLDGTWTIGTSQSSHGPFGDLQTVQWADTDWQDIRIGDFDGDGRDDILARAGGAWWVMRFENDAFVTTRWDKWSNLDWQDVTVGDFDGDGTDDLAGRYAGAWWVGTSTGSSFYTTLWARWTEGGWDAVLAGDVNGVPAAVPSGTSGTGGATTGGTTTTGGFSTIIEIIKPIDLREAAIVPIDGQVGDESEPEICEDYPYLNNDDDTSVASADETTEPEICIDYPFLDSDPLFDELLTTA